MNLNEATAFVTGGSNGIGFAIAKRLIEAGARVAITGRDERRPVECWRAGLRQVNIRVMLWPSANGCCSAAIRSCVVPRGKGVGVT